VHCPLCGKLARTEQGLRKHLVGTKRRGGHGRSDEEAHRIAEATAMVAAASQVPPPARALAAATERVSPPGVAEDFLREVFDTLVSNKALPKYQLERRVDIFVSLFLPEILSQLLDGDVLMVAPELPIKERKSNRSKNADYLLLDRKAKRWLLVELKTDSSSVSAKQIQVYRDAVRRGMPALVDDVRAIRKAARGAHRKKYDALLELLEAHPADLPLELVYVAPVSLAATLDGAGEHALAFGDMSRLELDRHGQIWRLFRKMVLPALAG